MANNHISDEAIERAAEKLLAGKPLTRAERRLLESPLGDFAMGQVRALLDSGTKATGGRK